MRFLILVALCAVAQLALVLGATRAHKALITPLSLDAAQVGKTTLIMLFVHSAVLVLSLLVIAGRSSGRFQDFHTVI